MNASRNPYHYSDLKLLSSCPLSKMLKVRIYQTIVLSLNLMEEHKLQVYENKVLREIYKCKKDDIDEQHRILRNEELGEVDGTGS
jgi:hypothetical protein